MYLKRFVERPEARKCYGDLGRKWNIQKASQEKIINIDMTEYNSLYKSLNLPAIIIN